MIFCHLLTFFSKLTFSKKSFRNTTNSLDQDQARHFVGPDLSPNCLQRLSADNTRRQRVSHMCEIFFSRKTIKISLLAHNLLNQWVDFNQTCKEKFLGGWKELIRF